MRVKVGSSLSYFKCVTSGVPQGSVLGQILFLIYVNHVVSGLKCDYQIFADDIKLYLGFHHENFNSALNDFQYEIDKL